MTDRPRIVPKIMPMEKNDEHGDEDELVEVHCCFQGLDVGGETRLTIRVGVVGLVAS